MMNRLLKLLKNPIVQRVLVWAVPLLVGWALSKLDKKSEQSKRPKKRR